MKTPTLIALKSLKPRNPFVVASLNRKAGAHRRGEPARRQTAARALRVELKQMHRPEP